MAPDEEERIGLPGEPPFTRGIHPTGYRSRLWTMRMFAGFGSAEDTNQRFHQLLAAGQTGLSIAYDMPTLYGYDTDDPEAEGEFGTCGVGVSSLADMEVLLAGLPLDKVSTSMTINSPAAPIWAMYIVAAEKAGVPRERAARIAQEVGRILQMPEIKQRFQDAGLMTVGSMPEEFAAFIQRDLAFYTKLIRGAGIEPQ